MALTKLKRALYASVFAIMAFSSLFLVQDPFGVGVTFSPVRNIFQAFIVFFASYYFLGAFYGKKEDQPNVKYSYWSLELIRIMGLLLAIIAIIGFIMIFAKQNPVVLAIVMGLWYLFAFMVVMIHFYYAKKMSGVSIFIFIIAYIASGVFMVVLPNDSKIILLILFAVISILSLFYGVYVLLKYIAPRMIEHNFERRMRKYQSKIPSDKLKGSIKKSSKQ